CPGTRPRISCRGHLSGTGDRPLEERGTVPGSGLQLVELVHPVQELEHPARLGLVDPRQRETDVDQDVVARQDIGPVWFLTKPPSGRREARLYTKGRNPTP